MFLDNPEKVISLVRGPTLLIFKDPEIRELMYSFGHLKLAYFYNLNYDTKVNELAVKYACEANEHTAYWYGMEKGHHEDLRKKVSSGNTPALAYKYARYVEKKPHPITREGVGEEKAGYRGFGVWLKRYDVFEKQYRMSEMRKKR